jgi:hypothetical protein
MISIRLIAAFAAIAPLLTLAADKIVIGQSTPLTGSNAEIGKEIRAGALAYFKKVNDAGGVNGRQIELVSLDDKNDRKTAGQNAVKLVNENHVVALFGFASATLSLDAMPRSFNPVATRSNGLSSSCQIATSVCSTGPPASCSRVRSSSKAGVTT